MTLGEPGEPGANLSWNTEELDREGAGLSEAGNNALATLRDRLAPGEKLAWWLVYNGDPAREYPRSDDEEDEENEPEQSRPAVGFLLADVFGV